jgi:hypothetical protein
MDLASFNENTNSWVLDSGVYQVKAGQSVEDIKVSAPMKISKGVQKKVLAVI